jgi:hypothetical protein
MKAEVNGSIYTRKEIETLLRLLPEIIRIRRNMIKNGQDKAILCMDDITSFDWCTKDPYMSKVTYRTFTIKQIEDFLDDLSELIRWV